MLLFKSFYERNCQIKHWKRKFQLTKWLSTFSIFLKVLWKVVDEIRVKSSYSLNYVYVLAKISLVIRIICTFIFLFNFYCIIIEIFQWNQNINSYKVIHEYHFFNRYRFHSFFNYFHMKFVYMYSFLLTFCSARNYSNLLTSIKRKTMKCIY